MFEGALIERKHFSFGKNSVTPSCVGLQTSWGQLQHFMILCASTHRKRRSFIHQTEHITEVIITVTDRNQCLPTDRRVGLESRLQPWLRGILLRRWEPGAALTRWAPVLSVLRAVLVKTRPGEPEREPAADIRKQNEKKKKNCETDRPLKMYLILPMNSQTALYVKNSKNYFTVHKSQAQTSPTTNPHSYADTLLFIQTAIIHSTITITDTDDIKVLVLWFGVCAKREEWGLPSENVSMTTETSQTQMDMLTLHFDTPITESLHFPTQWHVKQGWAIWPNS